MGKTDNNKPEWATDGARLYFIAEAGVNHNGELKLAKELVDIAKASDADAIKFQSFSAEKLVTKSAPSAEYQKKAGEGQTQFEMLKRLELTRDEVFELANYCKDVGVTFISTPFDEDSADMLDEVGVSVYKISSGDLTNVDFLKHVARKNKPMIISTGMGNLAETERAVQAITETGNTQLAILHCVSNYPAKPHQSNLKAMATIENAFGFPVGWSDHMQDGTICLAATALKARIIEKHFTIDRNMTGPDHGASLEPDELTKLISDVRDVEASLGNGVKAPTPEEEETAIVARRSLTSDCDIAAGTVLTDDMIVARRPGNGIEPYLKPLVVGRKLSRDITAGETLSLDMLK